jgi:hypothetical protein
MGEESKSEQGGKESKKKKSSKQIEMKEFVKHLAKRRYPENEEAQKQFVQASEDRLLSQTLMVSIETAMQAAQDHLEEERTKWRTDKTVGHDGI